MQQSSHLSPRCVARRKAEGFALVVVVSAMGKTTDALFEQALEIDSEPPQRELDMLVTAGGAYR